MRILIIDNSIYKTGAFKAILGMVRKMQQAEFWFVVPKNSGVEAELIRNSIPCVQYPFVEVRRDFRILLYLPMLIINSLRILTFIKRNRIQIVHVNDLYNMCGIMIKILNPRVKVVYHIRLLPDSYVRSMYHVWRKIITRYADYIVFVSHAVAKHWVQGMKSTVIHDAVPEENIEYTVKSSGPYQLLYVANYIPGKGHHLAIHAFAKVLQAMPDTHLIFVGGVMGMQKNKLYKEGLVSLARKYGIEQSIRFNDYLSEIGEEMQRADIFLNFSDSESFSLTCLEALSFGVPTIATRSGGPSEIIEHGVSGLLVEKGDQEGMSEAILYLLANVHLRYTLSIKGKERAREKFNLNRQAGLLFDVYIRLLAARTSNTLRRLGA